MELVHKLNIIIHVLTGSISLALGLIALVSTKGGKIHRKCGRLFLKSVAIVIITGLVGIFLFGRNTFLLVITVLSGYVSFSGYRAVKLKSNNLSYPDILASFIALSVLFYFLYYFQSIGMIWSSIIIYSTIGALVFVVLYDFLKYFIPSKWYQKHDIWIYEHIYKMTSAFAALLSAFVGTVFDQYQPYSQFLPSVLGLLIIFGFIIYVRKYGLTSMRKTLK